MCKDLTPFSYFCRLKINPQAHGSKAFILENLCCCEHLCICVHMLQVKRHSVMRFFENLFPFIEFFR
jgi:hypothetical protein